MSAVFFFQTNVDLQKIVPLETLEPKTSKILPKEYIW